MSAMPRSSTWRSMPPDDWPQPDREAWEAARRRGGPLDPTGRASTLARHTQRTMQELYGQYLAWLQGRGELDPEAPPQSRLTHARLAEYLIARRTSVSDNTVFSNLRMLAMTMACLAPDHDWSWLYRHPQSPRRREAMAARRQVPLVRPGELLARLLATMTAVLAEPADRHTAGRLRDLLIVAVGATTALRLRNIAALTLGETILRHRHGYEIRFADSAVKNARAISIAVMPELAGALDRYIDLYRPLLVGRCHHRSQALWISIRGTRVRAGRIHMVFEEVGLLVLGRELRPHTLRHSAASAVLADRPRDAATASALLAHRDPDTVSTFYDLSGDAAAPGLERPRRDGAQDAAGPRSGP